MADHITHISENSCEFVQSLNTKVQGLIEVSRQLVTGASKIVTEYNNGEYDPEFVGEMLLLAGFSSLLASQNCKPTNFAIHFNGLTVQGKNLPVQSIYIAMKEDLEATPSSAARTHIQQRDVAPDEDSEEPQYPRHDTLKGVVSSIDYAAIQAELDAETPDEIMEMVREQESGASRFAGQPSVADEHLPESLGIANPNPSGSLKLPFQSRGLHGGRD